MTNNSSHPNVPILDLTQQHQNLDADLKEIFAELMKDNAYILGEELNEFEKAFAEFCGTEHCIGVSSGTEALRLALYAWGVGKGDEVITVPFTFAATVEAIVHTGATPVFVDIEPDTYTMNPEQVENRINERTEALLPVHLYGQPTNMDRIRSLATEHDLLLLEDACQAHGATWKDQRVGALGDLGCFSFYPGKNMGALGDAGAITTAVDTLADRIRSLRNHGQKNEKYRHFTPGFNSRMDNIQAAFLHEKLPELEDWNQKRNQHASRYDDQLEAVDQITTPDVDERATHVYHQYAIQTPERDRLQQFLSNRNIQTGIHYPRPLHLQPAFDHLSYEKGDFPVSERVGDRVLTLPCFPEMTQKQQDHVIQSITQYFDST